jgi:GAF domain-containing protein
MTNGPSTEWRDVSSDLNALEALVQARESLDETLSRIAVAGHELTPGCDSASVFLADGRVPHEELGVGRSIASDGFGLAIDELQIGLDEGPCLEAMRSGRNIAIDRMESDGMFPAFSNRAAALGLLSSYSVPLQIDEATVGSLNLYSRRGPFTVSVQQVGEAMAAQAALAIGNALRLRDAARVIADLRAAIATRDVIGKAKGILMERLDVCEADAFAHLVELSQRSNIKLKHVAAAVADGNWRGR